MFDLLLAGGPFMFATLAVSIITLVIAFLRAGILFGKGTKDKQLSDQISQHIEGGRITDALRLALASNSSLAAILKAVLMRADKSEKEIRRAAEAAALEEVPRTRGSVIFLPQLSNLATLLGLIGTIHGLIIAFSGAGSESAAMRQEVLSRGIAIAFYNTFFGLTVATLGVVCYLPLLAKTNSKLALMEHSTALVIDKLLGSREAKEVRRAR